MYLPDELWNKIYMYTVVVDKHRSKLLLDIRKAYMIKQIERQYRNDWIVDNDVSEWLYNDIMLWLNEEKASLFMITNKLKEFCSRNFYLIIEDNDDIDAMEIFLLNLPYMSIFASKSKGDVINSKKLWDYMVYHLKEDETYEFHKWVNKLRLFQENEGLYE